VLASFDLGYDLAGNVTSKASSVFSNPSNGTFTYDYDGASRLLQATGPNATGASTVRDYAYDGGGNRILNKETTGSVVSNWTTVYDTAGLPTSATNAVGGETVTYTHDAVGSLTKADSTTAANDWAYAYDAFSRLTCAKQATTCTSGTTRVLSTLDAFHRVYQRTYNGAVTDYTYQGVGELPVKTQVGAGTPTTYALTPGGAPLAEKTGSNTYFSLRDPHGDVVGLVTTSAANQGTTAFDPWGKPLGLTGTQGWFGYQGDPTDVVTKQVDMGTRHYQPGLGRFSSRDVVFGDPSSPMTLNQHVYGGLNPVTMWDPTGMTQERSEGSGECGQGCRGPGTVGHGHWKSDETAQGVYVPPPVPAPPIFYDPRIFVEPPVDATGAVETRGSSDSDTVAIYGRGVCPTLDDDDTGDGGCGLLAWRCWDDAAGKHGVGLKSTGGKLPEPSLQLVALVSALAREQPAVFRSAEASCLLARRQSPSIQRSSVPASLTLSG